MSNTSPLINIKSSKLHSLIEAIKEVRPEVKQYSGFAKWPKLPHDDRKNAISTFFAMQSFSEQELQKIVTKVFPPVITAGRVTFFLITLVILFVSIMYYRFSSLPKIYAIGNNIVVGDSIGDNIYIDIYGVSPLGQTTSASMLLIDSTEHNYITLKNSFLPWLFQQLNNLEVPIDQVVSDKNIYEKYKATFEAIKGSSDFFNIDVNDRKAIIKATEVNPELTNASIVVPNDTVVGYKPIIKSNPWGTENNMSSIFFCFKTTGGQFKNVQVILASNEYHSLENITCVGKPYEMPLVWKKEGLPHQPSIIYCRVPASNEECVSYQPPYPFTKK